MRSRRIAILMHEKDDKANLKNYLISILAEHWREDGHEVIFLFGTGRYVPADLLFVHVDLSVVPDSYLSFARRYPVAINGRIKDVRKSTYSQELLENDDPWDGPVIVKSKKNSAGIPERARGGLLGTAKEKLLKAVHKFNLNGSPLTIRTALDYRVYDHLEEVPRIYFYHPGLVVQKFLPETDDGFYCVRILLFLGDNMSCMRLKSRNSIINDASVEHYERIDPHPEILAMRKRLQFDYGKFDYVVNDGKPILLDANKTVGWPPNMSENVKMTESLRHHSSGLYSFFEE